MNVLLTGAAGFIGSHLADALLARGDSVLGVDNLLTGDLANLEHARRNPAFHFLEADAAKDFETIEQALEGCFEDVGLVLHFASPASPKDYTRFQLETLYANSLGTNFCCTVAKKNGARLLFASTSEVYGDPLEHPQSENYFGNVNPVGPRSCYDESKRFGEALIAGWVRERTLDARVVRIFNTYGPRMRSGDGRVVPAFLREALAGKPLTVFGGGHQTRSFCFIEDLVRGILDACTTQLAPGTVLNLGSAEEISILQLAMAVCEIAGVEPQFADAPLPQEDPARRRPDISRAQKLLGWTPCVGLDEGLRRTIGAIRS